MGRQKKVSKPKEPVRIRQRKLKNGNISLYLDIYSDGVRKYESLSLYLVPEKDPISKDQNRHAMQVANKVKEYWGCRTVASNNGRKSSRRICHC